MSPRILLLLLIIALFGTLTTIALLDVGYLGILLPHFRSWGEAQVLADLSILAVLACLWMIQDAPSSRLPSWPFILATLVAGSFGPLLYLFARELRRKGSPMD